MTAPRIEDIAAYMIERQMILLRRRSGTRPPWTGDPILRDHRFCNVFREDDAVTIWIDQNIRKPYAEHEHLWFMLAIARYINWPDTLTEMIEGYDDASWPSHTGFCPAAMTRALEARAARGEKVYTGAYMIRAESDPTKHWYAWSKHRYIAEIVLGRLWEDREEWSRALAPGKGELAGITDPTLEGVWRRFQIPRYIGWGPFMAYEVVTDLRHTRYLENAPDIYTWANAGPGAIRGLNWMYGRPIEKKPKPEQTNSEMHQLMLELNGMAEHGGKFGQLFHVKGEPAFEMRDVEHTLCEMFKYTRGYTRSKYNWKKSK